MGRCSHVVLICLVFKDISLAFENIEWREPVAGLRFEPEPIVVSTKDQADKLGACGLDPAVMQGDVDPSFYIGLAIRAGIRNGISAEGNINMLTRLIQHRPVRLDEELTFQGRIEAVEEVPRGLAVSTDAWFEDADGERVISAPRRSLKPDPAKAKSGAGERPAPVIGDSASLVMGETYTLTPERVKEYSSEGNAIHYEMDAAQKAGFRAPIIGGGMGVHYLVAAIRQQFNPKVLDMELYYRRPIFWDDTFQVGVEGEDDRWSAIGLVRDGKILTEARINELS